MLPSTQISTVSPESRNWDVSPVLSVAERVTLCPAAPEASEAVKYVVTDGWVYVGKMLKSRLPKSPKPPQAVARDMINRSGPRRARFAHLLLPPSHSTAP